MTRRERAQAKRRRAAEDGAVALLKAALADLPGRRMGTAEKRVRESAQPMTTARAIVRQWRQARSVSPETARPAGGNGTGAILDDETAVPDLSAATEARAAILRRQSPELRRWCAYEDELADLESALLKGRVSQGQFDSRCNRIAGRPLPDWLNGQAEQRVTGGF